MNINKNKFLKRPIRQIPCNGVGCNKILFTRAPSKKYCLKHSHLAKIGKLAKKNVRNRQRDLKSPCYDIKKIRRINCLKCGKMFDSISRYNRICVGCNYDNLTEGVGKKIGFGDNKVIRSLNEISKQLDYYEV